MTFSGPAESYVVAIFTATVVNNPRKQVQKHTRKTRDVLVAFDQELW